MKRVLALALLATAAAHADETARVYAYAYDLDTDKYLYTEVHDQKLRDGVLLTGTITYVMPDGQAFGRKTLDLTGDGTVPLYKLEMTKEGYVEGITANGGTITAMRQRSGGTAETTSLKREGLIAADAGLVRLLRDNMDALLKGETVAFRVVAPSRLDAYKFRARRGGETTFEGKPAFLIEVELNSMLNLFAGPLLFTFDSVTRKVVEFRGPTNVRNPATGKDYNVRLSFYTTPPKDVPKPP